MNYGEKSKNMSRKNANEFISMKKLVYFFYLNRPLENKFRSTLLKPYQNFHF